MTCPVAVGGKTRGPIGAEHQMPKTTRPCGPNDRRVQNRLRHFFNILCLEPFRTLCDRELNTVAFLQGLVSVTNNSRIVDEHVPARRPLDKTEALFIVKPLYLALLFTHYP